MRVIPENRVLVKLLENNNSLDTHNYIWNTNTLAWEAATGSLTGGNTVSVNNFPSSYQVTVQNTSLNVVSTTPALSVQMYEDGSNIYVCSAVMGSSLSSSVWQIKKVDTTSGVRIQWANGNALYNNKATDLATVKDITYS